MNLTRRDVEILSFKEKLLIPQPPTVYFTSFEYKKEYHFLLYDWIYTKQNRSQKFCVYDVFHAKAHEDYPESQVMTDEECYIHIAENSFLVALDWHYRKSNKRLQTAVDYTKNSDLDIKFIRKTKKIFEITNAFVIYKELEKYKGFDYQIK